MAAPSILRPSGTERQKDDKMPPDNACKICLRNEAKYTCPRCNLVYCSVSCYQDEKHTGCSEAFYKDCVINELQDMNSTEEDKKKVMDILIREMEEKENEDSVHEEDDNESLAERLKGLDLDKDVSAVWGRLSHKEKEEFAKMLQDGRMARLIELWNPWWKYPKNLSLVTEHVTKPDAEKKQEEDNTVMPMLMTDVPDINLLLKNSRPSSDCRFDLLNILFAYSFVSRIHNGDHYETPVDSSQLLLEVSVVLQCEERCASVGGAVQYSLDALSKYNKRDDKVDQSPHFKLTVLEDVSILVCGPGPVRSSQNSSLMFMIAALSDVTRLLQKALSVIKKELKQNKTKEENLFGLKSQLFKAEKKCVFFLSWLQRYGMGMQQLIPLLQLEIERRQSDVKEVEELKESVEHNMEQLRSKPCEEQKKLIEEL